jgi:hypothetical protein
VSSTLSDRYRTTTSTTTKLVIALGGLILAVLVVWLGWAIWFHGSSKVTSDLSVNYAVDDHHYKVEVNISLAKGVDPASVRCHVDAVAKDGSVVGGPELWRPKTGGGNTFVLTTTRRAVYLDWDGCRAPGQDDYR